MKMEEMLEIKRTLEMLTRKMDAIELGLEKKIDKKFEEQNKLIRSLIEKMDSPETLPPEGPWFYS